MQGEWATDGEQVAAVRVPAGLLRATRPASCATTKQATSFTPRLSFPAVPAAEELCLHHTRAGTHLWKWSCVM